MNWSRGELGCGSRLVEGSSGEPFGWAQGRLRRTRGSASADASAEALGGGHCSW